MMPSPSAGCSLNSHTVRSYSRARDTGLSSPIYASTLKPLEISFKTHGSLLWQSNTVASGSPLTGITADSQGCVGVPLFETDHPAQTARAASSGGGNGLASANTTSS